MSNLLAQAQTQTEDLTSTPETAITDAKTAESQSLQLNRYSPELLARLGSLTTETATVEWHHPEQGGDIQTVLVNIEQYHDRADLADLVGVEVADKAEKVQAQIAEILEAMKVDKIRLDGMTPEIAAGYVERFNYIKEVGQYAEQVISANPELKDSEATAQLLRQGLMRGLTSEQIDLLKIVQRYQGVKESLAEDALYDKFIERAAQGKMEVLAGEDPELQKASTSLLKKEPCIEVDDPRFKEISDKREQHLVNLVGEGGGEVKFVSMGSSHVLKEEVHTWNENNPDKLITLVRVTPTATSIEAEVKQGEDIHCK